MRSARLPQQVERDPRLGVGLSQDRSAGVGAHAVARPCRGFAGMVCVQQPRQRHAAKFALPPQRSAHV